MKLHSELCSGRHGKIASYQVLLQHVMRGCNCAQIIVFCGVFCLLAFCFVLFCFILRGNRCWIENCNEYFLHPVCPKHLFIASARFLLICVYPISLLYLHYSIRISSSSTFSNVTNDCQCELLWYLLSQGKNTCIVFCKNIPVWLQIDRNHILSQFMNHNLNGEARNLGCFSLFYLLKDKFTEKLWYKIILQMTRWKCFKVSPAVHSISLGLTPKSNVCFSSLQSSSQKRKPRSFGLHPSLLFSRFDVISMTFLAKINKLWPLKVSYLPYFLCKNPLVPFSPLMVWKLINNTNRTGRMERLHNHQQNCILYLPSSQSSTHCYLGVF